MNAKAAIASLQHFAQVEKHPLVGLAFVKGGAMPLLAGSKKVSRAAAKMQYVEGALHIIFGGEWAPAQKAASGEKDTSASAAEHLDDIEAVVCSKGSREVRQRRSLQLQCVSSAR